MAEEDLIFRLEGVDGGPTSRAGDSDADSDGEEGYFICPITDDPGAHQNVNSKVNNYYSNLAKSERYGSSGSPAISFHFKVSGPPLPPLPLPSSPAIGMGGWGRWLRLFPNSCQCVNPGSEAMPINLGRFGCFNISFITLEQCFTNSCSVPTSGLWKPWPVF